MKLIEKILMYWFVLSFKQPEFRMHAKASNNTNLFYRLLSIVYRIHSSDYVKA